MGKTPTLAFLLATTAAAAAAGPRYNVLLFTADDMHAESMRTYGSKVKDMTPPLDRFAPSGMVFTRAHVNAAICAPSRAIIATGLYSHRSGAMGFMPARPGTPDIVTTLQKGRQRRRAHALHAERPLRIHLQSVQRRQALVSQQ